MEILGQTELEGRSYSATLVAAVGDLLARAGARLSDLGAIVAVNGPGSFTGVRVGLSAVKGLAEAARIPVVAVSRLAGAGVRRPGWSRAALDAHRHEVFLRLGLADGKVAGVAGRSGRAGGDCVRRRRGLRFATKAAAALLESAWPEVRAGENGGSDGRGCAAAVARGRVAGAGFCGSGTAGRALSAAVGCGDFWRGDFRPSGQGARGMSGPEVRIRRMSAADLARVLEIGESLQEAPQWPVATYVAALDPLNLPRRIALVAEWAPL